ncbi:MAG: hypothetical protein QM780_16195 [Hyphomicrobium sp.]|uniref:hypothetical protein n=1 Tax=Hyphomicrobium sp. TaxID=82 RepID=UPI0039E5A992
MTGGGRAGGEEISSPVRTEWFQRKCFRDLVGGRYAEGCFAFLYSLLLVLGSWSMVALAAPPFIISAVDVLVLPICAWAIQAALRRVGGST